MADTRTVAYLRATDSRRGFVQSLEAQREALEAYLQSAGSALVAEVVETDRSKERPEFARALALAQRQGATLVVASLDRLARDPVFLRLVEAAQVEVAALDNPTFTRAALPVLAAVAEHERRVTGQKTRAALAKAKAAGKRLGAHGEVLARANKAAAYQRLLPRAAIFGALMGEGLSVRAMAARLNDLQIPSPGGGTWHGTSVQRALKRLAPERFAKPS